MKFVDLIGKELFCAGLNSKQFRQVSKSVFERNMQLVVSWAFSVSIFWCLSLMLSMQSDAYASCRTVYIFSVILCLLIALSGRFLVPSFPWLLYPLMYLLELSILLAGVGIAICQPDVRTVTMVAVAIITPIFFIDRMIMTVFTHIAMIIIYYILGVGVIDPDIFSWGMNNLIIFSAAGILTGVVVNKSRFERYVYLEDTKKLAEIRQNYNEELQKDVLAKTQRIVAMQNNFIMGMATLVEGRDNSTGGHILRTSTAVKYLVEAIREDNSLELSEDFCQKIITAAPMHDLGKITIDDDILRKPGAYTAEEYEIMKTHAAEGARILHNILIENDDEEFCRIAENVAHYHHEYVDGTGYPEGLKGDEIPIEARIMAIADVYDALVSKRIYKDRYSFEQVDQMILEGMGKQFDSNLKKYYIKARPRLEAYYAGIQESEKNN